MLSDVKDKFSFNTLMATLLSGRFEMLDSQQSRKENIYLDFKKDLSYSDYNSDSFVKAYLTREDTLEIEFFEDSDSIEISIQDQFGETLYEMRTFTTQTLHLIITIRDWMPGKYSIQVNNLEGKTSFSGFFNFQFS